MTLTEIDVNFGDKYKD